MFKLSLSAWGKIVHIGLYNKKLDILLSFYCIKVIFQINTFFKNMKFIKNEENQPAVVEQGAFKSVVRCITDGTTRVYTIIKEYLINIKKENML